MYTTSSLDWLCKDQRERRNVSNKAFILTYDNISRIMIYKGALAAYSQVEMLHRALPRKVRKNPVMKLKQDSKDPSLFKHDKLWTHVRGKCVTTDALALLDSAVACMAPGVSPYSVPTGVPLLQMPVVVNLLAIHYEENPASAQAREEMEYRYLYVNRKGVFIC